MVYLSKSYIFQNVYIKSYYTSNYKLIVTEVLGLRNMNFFVSQFSLYRNLVFYYIMFWLHARKF